LSDLDECVRAVLGGMLQHEFQSLFARFLAHFFENRYVAADNRLQRCAQISQNAARANGHAAHQPKIPDDPISRQIERRCHHV
jgi:hypothetical protein